MWKKLIETIVKYKIISLCAAGAMVLTVTAAVFIPKLMNQEALPTDNQQAVQQTEQQEQQIVDSEVQTETESTEIAEDNLKDNDGEEKENFINKIIHAFTGNKTQEDTGSNDDSPSIPSEKNYNVIFVTDGGSDLGQKTVTEGTQIKSLPTPYKDGYIFVGWYYDEKHTQPVASSDIVQNNITLYASYAQETPLEVMEQVTFASAQNVGSDFSITVVAEDKTMDAEAILSGITAENLTDPKQKGIITVSGSNGTFLIKGINPYEEGVDLPALDGFAEGATFRISLNDARLTFKDQPESVREYNFTTDKKEVA